MLQKILRSVSELAEKIKIGYCRFVNWLSYAGDTETIVKVGCFGMNTTWLLLSNLGIVGWWTLIGIFAVQMTFILYRALAATMIPYHICPIDDVSGFIIYHDCPDVPFHPGRNLCVLEITNAR